MNESEIRQRLRQWICQHNDKITESQLTDDLPIIEQRIITSLQTMDLILFIEQVSNKSVDIESLKPGAFRNIDTIYEKFFKESENAKTV